MTNTTPLVDLLGIVAILLAAFYYAHQQDKADEKERANDC